MFLIKISPNKVILQLQMFTGCIRVGSRKCVFVHTGVVILVQWKVRVGYFGIVAYSGFLAYLW